MLETMLPVLEEFLQPQYQIISENKGFNDTIISMAKTCHYQTPEEISKIKWCLNELKNTINCKDYKPNSLEFWFLWDSMYGEEGLSSVVIEDAKIPNNPDKLIDRMKVYLYNVDFLVLIYNNKGFRKIQEYAQDIEFLQILKYPYKSQYFNQARFPQLRYDKKPYIVVVYDMQAIRDNLDKFVSIKW